MAPLCTTLDGLAFFWGHLGAPSTNVLHKWIEAVDSGSSVNLEDQFNTLVGGEHVILWIFVGLTSTRLVDHLRIVGLSYRMKLVVVVALLNGVLGIGTHCIIF